MLPYYCRVHSSHSHTELAHTHRETSETAMAESYHWRMQLNNYLQANGGPRLLTWDVHQSGPLHQPSWTAIAYIRGIEYARCVGSSQSAVKEEAARKTLSALYADRQGRGYC